MHFNLTARVNRESANYSLPISFGETGVKTRIREILSYKKPSLRLTLAALIVSFTVSGCLLADPKTETAAVNGSLNTDAQSGAADDVFLPSDYFNTWFSSNETGRTDFANSCLSSFYDSPQDIDLNKFFYNGFSAEIEDADISFLENQGADLSMDIIKLPRTDMDRILTQYFGITLAETSRKGMENFYYNPETDTYYTLHNDCFYEYINIQEQHPGENGTITIIYTTKSLPDSTGENEKRTAGHSGKNPEDAHAAGDEAGREGADQGKSQGVDQGQDCKGKSERRPKEPGALGT